MSVWIDVPLVELIPRIPMDGRRPLASTRADLERLYAARADTYRLAHVHVAAAGHDVGATVDHIVQAVADLPPALPGHEPAR